MNIFPPTRFYALSFLVKTLRDSLLEGKWDHSLPPERELAAQLQVSRSTLRKALRILEEEGLVIINQGKPTLISIPEATGPQPQPHHVQLIYPLASNASGITNEHAPPEDPGRLGREIELRLHNAGIPYSEIHLPPQANRINTLLKKSERPPQNRTLWVLLQPTAAQEEWFAIHAPETTLLARAGTTDHPLPYVDIHHEAVGRHIGALVNQRHYQSLHLLSDSSSAPRARHLLSGIQATLRHTEQPADIVHLHQFTPEQLPKALPLLLRQLAQRPFPLLAVTNNELLPALLYHLSQATQHPPHELSLLSTAGPLLSPGFPIEPAHYENPESKIAKAIVQQVIDVMHIDGLRFQRRLFIPEFHPGNTLAQPQVAPVAPNAVPLQALS